MWDGVFKGVHPESIQVPSPLAVEVGALIETFIEPGSSLLEAGSGSGALSAHLVQRGYRTTLLDQSPVALELSRQVYERFDLKGEFVTGDLFGMPFSDDEFDCVWNSGVLEHFSDERIVEGLMEMTRITRRLVIVLVPNAASVFYRAGKWALERAGTWAYGQEYPRYSSGELFERAGLRLVGEGYLGMDLGIEWLQNLGALDKGVTTLLHHWSNSLGQEDQPIRRALSYLLATVGEKR